MTNKTRAPRRLFRARRATAKPVNHAERFRAALQTVEVEDFFADGGPCYLCSMPTTSLAARLTGYASGTKVVEIVHLCRACRAGDGIARLDVILDQEAKQS